MINACAIATRCCMPPESWCGYLRASDSSSPVCRRYRSASSRNRRICFGCTQRIRWPGSERSDLQAERDIVQHGLVGKQRIFLRYVAADAGPADYRSQPFTSTRPRVGFSSPRISRSKVDFPQPVSPTMVTNSPLVDLERNTVEHRARGMTAGQILDVHILDLNCSAGSGSSQRFLKPGMQLVVELVHARNPPETAAKPPTARRE